MQTLKVNGARLMEQDLTTFVPLSLLLVIIVLIIEFRTVRGVMLPLASVVVGTVWTTGVMVLAGSAINMGTLILPPLLMAIGIAYAIHVVSRYYIELRPGRPRAEVVAATLEHIRLPVAVAWLTTVVGCATLIFNPIHAIRDFGVYSVVGITAIFVVSLLLIPAALVLLPDPPVPPSAGGRGGWAAGVGRRRRPLGGGAPPSRAGSAGWRSCALSLWGATRIRIETDYLKFFSPESVFRRDNRRIAEALGGTQPIYVTIEGDEPGAMQRLETLAAIRDLQQFIAEQPGVDGSLSLADYVGLVQGVLNPERGRTLPENQADVDQLLLFVNPTDIAPVVARDYARANIIVRIAAIGFGRGRRVRARGRRLRPVAPAPRHGGARHRQPGAAQPLGRRPGARAGGGTLAGPGRAVPDHVADLPVAARRLAVAGAQRPADPRPVRPHGLDRHHVEHLHQHDRGDRHRHRGRRHHPLLQRVQRAAARHRRPGARHPQHRAHRRAADRLLGDGADRRLRRSSACRTFSRSATSACSPARRWSPTWSPSCSSRRRS